MNAVEEVLARKGLNIQEAKVSVQDRNEGCILGNSLLNKCFLGSQALSYMISLSSLFQF